MFQGNFSVLPQMRLCLLGDDMQDGKILMSSTIVFLIIFYF